MYYLCSENKDADQLRSYCGFVFTYTDCWFSHEVAQMHFVKFFTGKYKQKNHNEILNQARKKITDVMNVMPIRVQAPKLKYDNSFVYVSAMLLDRSPYEGISLFQL